MSKSKSVLLEKIEELVAPALRDRDMELVDLEFVHEHGQWILRFFLDKPGGITLDNCAEASDHLGRLLDATEIVAQSYSLEVSSPGVYRPLKKESDYQRFTGERVDVTLYAPLEGRRHFKGILAGVQEGKVMVEEAPDKRFALPLTDVAKARLDPDIEI